VVEVCGAPAAAPGPFAKGRKRFSELDGFREAARVGVPLAEAFEHVV
jgi:hypothetical protein